MMPLTKPILVSVILLNFLHNWNELLLALTMVTRPDLRTLPVAMMNFVGESASNFAMASAALVVGMLPVLVLYILFADKFVKSLTAGAVKG
jgi:ABC-type glycerol-3-phosphate transport system permease component